MKKQKNKRIIIVAVIVAVLLIIGITALIIISVNKGKKKLFSDSDYPCWYKQKKENIVLSVDGRVTKDVNWKVEYDDSKIDILSNGKESGGKVKYTLTPKKAGLCDIRLTKTKEVSGYEFEMVSLYINAYVEEVETGLEVRILDNNKLVDNGGADGGRNTDYPYLLIDQNDDTGKILFINGANDWRVSSDNDMVYMEDVVSEDNRSGIIVRYNTSYDGSDTVDNGPHNTEEDNEKKGEVPADLDSGDTTEEEKYNLPKDPEDIVITKDDINEDGTINIDLSEYIVEGETEVRPEVEAVIERKLNELIGDEKPSEEAAEETVETDDLGIESADSTEAADDNPDDKAKGSNDTKDKETVLTVSSESLGVTEYIKVVVRPEGKVMLYNGKKK